MRNLRLFCVTALLSYCYRGSSVTLAKTFVYNHLSQITSTTDASGTHEYSYNGYSEIIKDSQELATGKTSYREEQYDDYGRSSGYTYNRNYKTLAKTII